jgi:hypothetical protein
MEEFLRAIAGVGNMVIGPWEPIIFLLRSCFWFVLELPRRADRKLKWLYSGVGGYFTIL